MNGIEIYRSAWRPERLSRLTWTGRQLRHGCRCLTAMRWYRRHWGRGRTMRFRRGLRWCEGERGRRILWRGWRGKVAHASKLGVPVADLPHPRLELLHTLSHKAKESIEILDADVEHRGILLERFGLLVDTHSLLWSM